MILSQDTFNFSSSVLLLYNHPKAILKQQFIIPHKSVILEFCEGSRRVIFCSTLSGRGLLICLHPACSQSGRSNEALFMYLGPHLFSTCLCKWLAWSFMSFQAEFQKRNSRKQNPKVLFFYLNIFINFQKDMKGKGEKHQYENETLIGSLLPLGIKP